MKTKNALSTLALLFITTMCLAGGKLWIKGSVIDPLYDFEQVTLEVVVNGNEVHTIPFSKKGDFQIRIYEDDQYTLNFKRDGYITTSIIVNTHVPAQTSLVGNIEFDIVMQRQGRLDDAQMICAIYDWSDEKETLVYSVPDEEEIHFALNK